MKFLSILLIFFGQAFINFQPQRPNVKISLVSSSGIYIDHHGLKYPKVTFQIHNKSKKPVIISVFDIANHFDPWGDTLEFDNQRKRWLYRTDSGRATPWNERPPLFRGSYTLKAGERKNFDHVGNRKDFGKRLKRTVYVSFEGSGPPVEVHTPPFSFIEEPR